MVWDAIYEGGLYIYCGVVAGRRKGHAAGNTRTHTHGSVTARGRSGGGREPGVALGGVAEQMVSAGPRPSDDAVFGEVAELHVAEGLPGADDGDV